MWHDESMAVLWQDDKLNPETIVKLFERERHAWLEMADSVEQMKPSLVSGGAVAIATTHVHDCRARAEALKKLIVRLCEQFGLPATPQP
jgi:hypothetical protein